MKDRLKERQKGGGLEGRKHKKTLCSQICRLCNSVREGGEENLKISNSRSSSLI